MAIPSLPCEIILLILEAGYFNHKFRPDRYFLSNCSLVCQTWASQAQPLLFRHIEVRRPSSLSGLKEALTLPTPRRGALKDVVLWLRIWVGFSDSTSRPETLSLLLATCSNLYGLSVTFRDMWTLPEEPLFLPPNVLALECCDWEGKFGYHISRILIRSGWYSLRILVLRGNPILEFSPNLTELRIEGVTPISNLTHQDPTIREPQLNLRILEVTNYIAYVRLLELSQHSLESIYIPWIVIPMFLKDCRRLREFKIETYLSLELVHILRHLPLEHLAFSVQRPCYDREYSRECVAWSSLLRVVSCLTTIRPWDEGMTLFVNELARICDRKHIQLDLYTNLVSFRAFTRGSLVHTNTFPRGLIVPSYSRLRLNSALDTFETA